MEGQELRAGGRPLGSADLGYGADLGETFFRMETRDRPWWIWRTTGLAAGAFEAVVTGHCAQGSAGAVELEEAVRRVKDAGAPSDGA